MFISHRFGRQHEKYVDEKNHLSTSRSRPRMAGHYIFMNQETQTHTHSHAVHAKKEEIKEDVACQRHVSSIFGVAKPLNLPPVDGFIQPRGA
jgi:hypothetical protein